jgi:hypothetical protein
MEPNGIIDRARAFVNEHFERLLVVLLVVSLAGIHWVIDDYKVAFLSFYYLPVIVAGFQLGRNNATYAALLIVALVAFIQAVAGLGAHAGLDLATLFTLVPWAGFLILTAYTVGGLADQRRERLSEVKSAYMTVLELLTFHIESTERHARGHSFHVAARAVGIAQRMGLRSEDVEALRVAALLHELRPDDPRIGTLFEHFPGGTRTLPVVRSMRSALDIVGEYARYYELIGPAWPVDHLRVSAGTKILAVADAFETLQLPTTSRPPLSVWGALEEIERGKGSMFGTEAVNALRSVVTPLRTVEMPVLAAI